MSLRILFLLSAISCLSIAGRCKWRYRESRVNEQVIRQPRVSRNCRGRVSLAGEEYWSSVGYDGRLREGRTTNDFLTVPHTGGGQVRDGWVAYWITKDRYGPGVHYEIFGHAYLRPDGRICARFAGRDRDAIELCEGFRVLSRNRFNPSEECPFEWVQAAYVRPREAIGFHHHRIAKNEESPDDAYYGDANLRERTFRGVPPNAQIFVELLDPNMFARKIWVLRRKPEVAAAIEAQYPFYPSRGEGRRYPQDYGPSFPRGDEAGSRGLPAIGGGAQDWPPKTSARDGDGERSNNQSSAVGQGAQPSWPQPDTQSKSDGEMGGTPGPDVGDGVESARPDWRESDAQSQAVPQREDYPETAQDGRLYPDSGADQQQPSWDSANRERQGEAVPGEEPREEVRVRYIRPPVIVTDQHGRRYRTKTENGQTYYYAEDHGQDAAARSRPTDERQQPDKKWRTYPEAVHDQTQQYGISEQQGQHPHSQDPRQQSAQGEQSMQQQHDPRQYPSQEDHDRQQQAGREQPQDPRQYPGQEGARQQHGMPSQQQDPRQYSGQQDPTQQQGERGQQQDSRQHPGDPRQQNNQHSQQQEPRQYSGQQDLAQQQGEGWRQQQESRQYPGDPRQQQNNQQSQQQDPRQYSGHQDQRQQQGERRDQQQDPRQYPGQQDPRQQQDDMQSQQQDPRQDSGQQDQRQQQSERWGQQDPRQYSGQEDPRQQQDDMQSQQQDPRQYSGQQDQAQQEVETREQPQDSRRADEEDRLRKQNGERQEQQSDPRYTQEEHTRRHHAHRHPHHQDPRQRQEQNYKQTQQQDPRQYSAQDDRSRQEQDYNQPQQQGARQYPSQDERSRQEQDHRQTQQQGSRQYTPQIENSRQGQNDQAPQHGSRQHPTSQGEHMRQQQDQRSQQQDLSQYPPQRESQSDYEARRKAYYEEYTRTLEQRKQEAQRRRAEEERRRAELARQGERQEYDERDLPQLLKPEIQIPEANPPFEPQAEMNESGEVSQYPARLPPPRPLLKEEVENDDQ